MQHATLVRRAQASAELAGELDGGWAMDWRRQLFFLLVKFQARWPLVPRISFGESAGRELSTEKT